MKRSVVYIVAGLAAVLVLFAITIGGTYNSMVASREGVRTSLAKVQSQYQRRADLVPNLVETVKGAANFEQSTLTKVVEARAKATSTTIDPSKASIGNRVTKIDDIVRTIDVFIRISRVPFIACRPRFVKKLRKINIKSNK
jgi:hypothetical protein